MTTKKQLRLKIKASQCCAVTENMTPIVVVWTENGMHRVGVAVFCKQCGWIGLGSDQIAILSQDGEMKGELHKQLQKSFDKLTQKVEYICFLDKVDNTLVNLMNKELLLFENQKK